MTDESNGNGRRRGWWLAFTLDTDHDQARAIFEARHGYPPADVVESGPILLVGPIGGNGQLLNFSSLTGADGKQRPGLLAQVEAAQVALTPERARQLALTFEEAVT